jgi:CTP synthase (UTP-ammonia lyase)
MEIIFDFDTNIRRAFEEIDPNWESYDALVVAGTHNPRNVEEVIEKIRHARETGRPLYGECFGHQLVAIEHARNVLGIKDATSEEFGQGTFVVKKRDKLNVGLKDGESYWHNYETTIDWQNPPHFFTSQAHPSYQSSVFNHHPLIVSFLKLCKNTK